MTSKKASTLALVGAKWLTLGTVLQKVFQILTLVVLARLLSPEDLGLIAAATMAISVLITLKDFGMPLALVKRQEEVQEGSNILWALSLSTSLLFYGGLFAAAPFLGRFFRHDLVGPVFRLLSIQLFTDAACTVQKTLAMKELKARLLMALILCETVACSVVSVFLAFKGFGVWSMIYGSLAGWILTAVLWWIAHPWRPTFRFDLRVAREMAGFGVKTAASSVMANALDALLPFAVGRWQGIARLGVYDLTQRIVFFPVRQIVLTVGQKLTVPAFCMVQEDLKVVQSWYLGLLRFIGFLMAPMAVCLLVLPDLCVLSVFGPKWQTAIPLVRILSLCVLAVPVGYANPIYISAGRVDLLVKLALAKLVVIGSLVIAAAHVSVTAVCSVQTITACFFAGVNLSLVSRVIKVPLSSLLKHFLIPLEGNLVLAVLLLAARYALSLLSLEPNLLTLLFSVLPGGLLYLAFLRWRRPEMMSELTSALRQALGLS